MSLNRYFSFTAATIKSMNEAQLLELFSTLDDKTIATVFGALCKHIEVKLKGMISKPELSTGVDEAQNARINEEIKKMGY